MTQPTLFLKREALRKFYSQGIKPVDGRQPIPEELAQEMVKELVELNVPKDAYVGVIDTFLTLTLVLKEYGFTNVTLLENTHQNLTSSQERYYSNIRGICDKIEVKYYVPPMNNYNRCDMKFDVIIGNPPYQSENGGGNKRGSANSPLWKKIVDTTIPLLKDNGIISFITPTNIVNGGDMFTKDFLGSKRKYDLKKVYFDIQDYFNIGISVCRWVVCNQLTENNVSIVSDGRNVNTDLVSKINPDAMFDSIVNALISAGNSFRFDTKKSFHYSFVEKQLEKKGLPVEWARDLKDTSDDVYTYPINVNGKIKYSRVKVMDGMWRVFYPQLQIPAVITVDFDTVPATSTFNTIVSSKEEGMKMKEVLENPLYRWIIDQTRVSGRVSPIIGKFTNTPIEQVLTPEQLSYIQSQL